MSTHFIVLITGQNISNLAPILNEYRYGDTVWLLGSEIVDSRGHLVKSFESLLAGYYLILCKQASEPIGTTADAVVEAMDKLLEQIDCAAGEGDCVRLVANGGTKPMAHAVDQVLRETFSNFGAPKLQRLTLLPAIYAEAEPVRLLELEPGGLSKRAYWKDPCSSGSAGVQQAGWAVKLQDVLACAGYALATSGQQPLYSVSGEDCDTSLCAPEWQGCLNKFIEVFRPADEQHQALRKMLEEWLNDPGPSRLPRLSLEAAKQAVAPLMPLPAELKKWETLEEQLAASILDAAVRKRLTSAKDIAGDVQQLQAKVTRIQAWLNGAKNELSQGTLCGTSSDLDQRREGLAQMLEPLFEDEKAVLGVNLPSTAFKAAVALHEKAQRALHPATAQPKGKLGRDFEDAVAARVQKLVTSNEDIRSVVSQVWHQVKLARAGSTEKVIGEWDVVLVLRNGILVCIECKSWTAAEKTLKAQQRMVHAGGSALARMWVCSPMVTAAETEAFFSEHHKFRQTCEEIGLEHLPFTIEEGHREEYSADNKNFKCPSFEDAFKELFNRYLKGDTVCEPCDVFAQDD